MNEEFEESHKKAAKKPAFLVRMLKTSYERYKPYDNSFLTKRHSRMFGRHFDEIEELIDQ